MTNELCLYKLPDGSVVCRPCEAGEGDLIGNAPIGLEPGTYEANDSRLGIGIDTGPEV